MDNKIEIAPIHNANKEIRIYPPNGKTKFFKAQMHVCTCGNENLIGNAKYCQECGRRIVGIQTPDNDSI